MEELRLPSWSGALIGVAAAAALTWLLRQGTQEFLSAVRTADSRGLMASGWLLILGSFILAAVLWSPRFHPLITGVPAAWFLIRFGPTLLGTAGTPDWYPEWIGRYILQDLNEAAFIVTGLLVAATLGELFRRRPSEASVAQSEQVAR